MEEEVVRRKMRKDVPMQCYYDDFMRPHRFFPDTYVAVEDIERFRIPMEYFIHPDSLRIKGAFDFAHKKKGKFSVGIIRMMYGRGDVLMASTIAKALKHRYGGAVKVWMAIRSEYSPLLDHNPYVDKVFSSEKQLMAAQPDVHLNVDDLEFKFEKKTFEAEGKVIQNRTSIYLEQIGLAIENRTPLYVVTEGEKKWARKELEKRGFDLSKPIIGIELVGSNISRTYPRMKEFGGWLSKKYQIIYLDEKSGDKYRYSLREVGGLVHEVGVTVTSNTFLYHLAGCMGKRAVALFGSCDGNIWTEDYEKVIPAQIPCPFKWPDRCWWQLKCLKHIPDEEVFREKVVNRAPDCLSQIPFELIEEKIKKQFAVRKILVVVLTWDLLKYTKQMLDSIRSFHNYDILVVDNESADTTVKYMKERGIRTIVKKQGVAEAWNTAVQIGYNEGYDYVLLCNNDIVLTATYIDELVQIIERRKCAAVVGMEINKDRYSTPHKFPEGVKEVEAAVGTMLPGDYSAILLSRGAIEITGLFNVRFGPRYQIDDDHLLRLRLAGGELIRTHMETFLHVGGGVCHNMKEERDKMDMEWDKNVRLFREEWKVEMYGDRAILSNISEMKRRNPDWKKKVCIPFEGLKKK